MVREMTKSRGMKSLGAYLSGAARSITARLARAAGLTARPTAGGLEQLEERRLMFALTVTAQDVDPQTGLGTVDAYFGYAIPYLGTNVDEQDQDPQVEQINFNEQALGNLVTGAPVVIDGSLLRVESNVVPFTDLQIVGQAPDNDQRWIRVNPGVGEFVRFSFVSTEDDVNAPLVSVNTFAINMAADRTRPGDNTGVIPSQFAVTVVFGTGEQQTFTGAALQALFQGNSAVGVDTLVVTDDLRGVQSVEIRRTAPAQGDIPSFELDDAAITPFAGRFTELVQSTLFGAHLQLTGPVGASVVVRDLLGRDMRQTLAVGVVDDATIAIPLIDLNDDGIPDFNAGIGSITVTGNDSRTAISLYGGTLEVAEDAPDNAESSDGIHHFIPIADLAGLHDDFEEAGFGYTSQADNDQLLIGGLPPVGGSVIIGSPFLRPAGNQFGTLGGTITTGFSRPDQGIFVDSGNIGRVTLHAVMHGSSRFAGFVNELNVAYMVGSVSVAGDLGTAMFGVDAGMYSEIGDTTLGIPAVVKTDSQLVVGRTLGAMLVGGRNLIDVTVVGDLDSPADRPARDSFHYYEKEVIFGVADQTLDAYIGRLTNGTNFIGRQATDQVRQDSPMLWGGGSYRNDSLTSAEFLSVSTTGVRISGELSGVDAINGEDTADAFAFAGRAGQTIVIQATGVAGRESAPYTRIVDQNGRTLAATELPFGDGQFQVNELRWTPSVDGVYYIVFTDRQGNDTGTGANPYTAVVVGMAATVFGDYRTGGSSGFTDLQNNADTSVTVLSGDMGMMRIGVSLLQGGAGEIDPTALANTDLGADDFMAFSGGTYTISGSLFGLITGSDVGVDGGAQNPIRVTVGGNMGNMYTGQSQAVGGSANQGDVNFFQLRVGGSVGDIRISGGVGMDQDADDPRARITGQPNHVQIVTGTAGGSGNIGLVRLGSHMVNGALTLNTSPGSIVGGFLVSQDKYYGDRPGDGRFGMYRGQQTEITTGLGSDIRFADVPRFDLADENRNVFFQLRNGEALELTDDGGSRITITLTGVTNAATNVVRVIPIDGSQGVVIAGIDVNLAAPDGTALGATLTIAASNPAGAGVVGIGRITLLGGDATSNIQIQGSVEVDVYQIIQTNGEAFGDITNATPGGDIIAMDVASVRNVTIQGNLGSATTGAGGPTLSAPFLGFGQGNGGEGENPLPVPPGPFDDDFNGQVYRPIANDNFDQGNAFLDDIGGPYDGYLNGIIARNGNIFNITANGSVGDVIAVGNVVNRVVANNGLVTNPGTFDGIVGSIFAAEIGSVDLGDGLAATNGPLAQAGIFATDDIGSVTSSRTTGVVVLGTIIASNEVALDDEADQQQPDPNEPAPILGEGINTLSFTGANIVGAFIGVNTLDRFWRGYEYVDDSIGNGLIQTITVSNSTFLRSRVDGDRLGNMTLTATDFDASRVTMRGDINSISVRSAKNSTLTGDEFERVESIISTGGNVRTFTSQLDIEDLTFDIVGSVLGSITARNIIRSRFEVDNQIRGLNIAQDIRGSSFNAGEASTIAIGRNIANSTIRLSGAVQTLSAGNQITNTRIEVTGPDAAIQLLTAPNLIQGEIAVSGPIGSISVPAGDLRARITTTTVRGNVTSLSAARDLAIETDISGSIAGLTAGRHIGVLDTPTVILSRGDIATVSIPAGQLYADIRAGGSVTGTVTIGGAVNKPGNALASTGSIIAFGRIGTVALNGDFGGDIISHSGGITSITVTNGSLLPGNTIAAYDGTIGAVAITNGNLYANIHADFSITSITVTAGVDGVFGDVGVNEALSQSSNYDTLRNSLPAGVFNSASIQGPRITAGHSIGTFTVTNGSVFETTIWAGRSITSISINGSIAKDGQTSGAASLIAAGDSIDLVTVTGSASDARFIAGLVALGSDALPGGTGTRADTVQRGDIRIVNINGGTSNVSFTAGMNAGADGIYNTSDDRQTPGLSTVTALNLGGTVSATSVFGDNLSAAVNGDSRLTRGGTNLAVVNTNPVTNSNPTGDPDTDLGSGTPGTSFTGTSSFTSGAATYTFTIAGPGTGFFDAITNRLTLRGTTAATNLTLVSTGTFNSFDLVTQDDSSLGILTVNSAVDGDSDFIIDGSVTTMNFKAFGGTGTLRVGGNVTTAAFLGFSGGFFTGAALTTLSITGDFGAASANVTNEARVQLISLGTATITGANRGLISVDRDITSVTMGTTERGNVRSGGSIGALSTGALSQAVVSARDNIGAVVVNGAMSESTISAGTDLGTDGFFGGSGTASDVLSSGSIASVTITGAFTRSNIVAGYSRGTDAYYGTADDRISSGRSTIGPVTITGAATGSTRSSESYRIASNGTIGAVRAAAAAFVGNGNLQLEAPALLPSSVEVTDVVTSTTGRVFSARLVFNQAIDFSSATRAISVLEIRGTGEQTIRLIEGIDYTLTNEASTNTILVTFSQNVTSANQPQVPGRPGPGLYRFEIEQSLFRAKLGGAIVDGNGDGFAASGEDYSQDVIIGDAGDKFTAETVTLVNGAFSHRVDLYAPINLDVMLDSNYTPDGLVDANIQTTIRGFIGDHPDINANFFRFAADVDIYKLTIQAGQILRLGGMQGAASRADLVLHTADGTPIATIGSDDIATTLPTDLADAVDITFAQAFFIKQTGVYYISVSNDGVAAPGEVPAVVSAVGGTGEYSFTLELFDDGDSGFNADTDSGDGAAIVDAPPILQFAGADGVFGSGDDVTQITVRDYVYTLNRGADGIANTADDTVTGGNNSGVTITRNASGTITRTIESAIGARGHAGVPGDIAADIDVFHLNDRLAIQAGTKMRLTLKLAQFGADMGSVTTIVGLENDSRGDVQLGLFDTTNSSGFGDATLVFSPTDFSPNGGPANTVIADNGSTKYGFDADGDYFIEFVVPERLGGSGNGSFALYVQGVYNTDYTIQLDTIGTGTRATTSQNVFIETEGGSVDWLQVAGQVTNLISFDASSLGFRGSFANGSTVRDYIVDSLISRLNAIYDAAGLDVTFSNNASDFAFEDYSTVYLSSSVDMLAPLFDTFASLNSLFLGAGFFSTQPYGFSQHSDPFNADLNDEAVVFAPSFALLGLGPTQDDADEYVQSLTAAVGRRVGELMGLRVTDPYAIGGEADIQSANSPANPVAADATWTLSNTNRRLSGPTDGIERTNFYLGRQNASSLLARIISPG
jgi:hypothetical protein